MVARRQWGRRVDESVRLLCKNRIVTSRDPGRPRYVLGFSGMLSPPERALIREHASTQPRKPYTPSPSPSSSQSLESSSNVSPIRRRSSISRRSLNGTGLRGRVGDRVKRRSGLQRQPVIGRKIMDTAHYITHRYGTISSRMSTSFLAASRKTSTPASLLTRPTPTRPFRIPRVTVPGEPSRPVWRVRSKEADSGEYKSRGAIDGKGQMGGRCS